MKVTSVFNKNSNASTDYVVNQGGTWSSKTYSLLQLMLVIATQNSVLISVVSETLPHLKKGAILDFENILRAEGFYNEKMHNKTDNIFTIGESKVEFFSADNDGKVHGPRRDYLFVNEANNVNWKIFDQLAIRTRKQIFIDYNPVSEFWAHTKLIPKDNVTFIKSTYLDNNTNGTTNVPERVYRDIESRKDDVNWWRVYGLGEVGTLEGLIFEFNIVEGVPVDAKQLGYGLDFGYSNDPTALIDGYLFNNELYFDELIYETGLTNPDIFNKVNGFINLRTEVIADSAEPKSIEELSRLRWNVKPVVKGKDSIINGIDIMRRYKINITKRSVNLIKEFRNYEWAIDKNGVKQNKPIDKWNHGIDAARYLCLNKIGKRPNKILSFA